MVDYGLFWLLAAAIGLWMLRGDLWPLMVKLARPDAARTELERRAWHDALTGLPNRALLKDRLEQALSLAERNGGLVAVHMLDLDHFKQVNDTSGHAAGDALLREVARLVGKCLRGSDTVARLGGDEFAVIQPQPEDEDAVAQLAKRIHECLKSVTSVSIGVALYPRDAEDAEGLLKAADVALYAVKRRGRNGVLMVGMLAA
jgi:diguanylate cyclase (GGDEF)-like protein